MRNTLQLLINSIILLSVFLLANCLEENGGIDRSKEIRDSLTGELVLLTEDKALCTVSAKDGGIGTELIDHVASAGPKWSPDGSKIACIRLNSDLAIIDALTFEIKHFPLTLVNHGTISWSDDGLYVAVLRGNYIYYVNTITGEIELNQLKAETPLEQYTSIAWWPNGNKIAIALSHGDAYLKDKNSIWLFEAFDDNPQKDPGNLLLEVPSQIHEVAYMDWSPDGSMLAYSEADFGNMCIVNYDGSDNRVIIRNDLTSNVPIPGYAPSWAKNNEQIVFTGVSGYTGPDLIIVQGLFVTDISGSYIVNIQIDGILPDWH